MRFDIITIFPKIFDSYLGESILRRAQARKLVTICSHDMRKFSGDPHKKVDDQPYGGGAGMVIQAEPILRAVEAILKKNSKHEIRNSKQFQNTKSRKIKTKIVILSAKGKQFTQKMAYDWVKKYNQLVLISGRYEGIDERVFRALKYITRKDNISSYSKKYYHSIPVSVDEISIGPYVLTDGDAAAMVIISAVARLIPGVISFESLKEESFFNNHFNNQLKVESRESVRQVSQNASDAWVDGLEAAQVEYPHYTRPEVFIWQGKTYRVPKILLSGDHRKIAAWRRNKMK